MACVFPFSVNLEKKEEMDRTKYLFSSKHGGQPFLSKVSLNFMLSIAVLNAITTCGVIRTMRGIMTGFIRWEKMNWKVNHCVNSSYLMLA